MNTKEAAEKWGVTSNTVSTWCREGWLESAILDDKNQWQINDDALAPLKFTDKKQKEFEQRLILILTALSQRKTIPSIKLHCNKKELEEHFEELLQKKFIKKRQEGSQDIFKKYILTLEGSENLRDKKGLRKLLKDFSPVISAVSEGATNALKL